jgi:hypothetical protein
LVGWGGLVGVGWGLGVPRAGACGRGRGRRAGSRVFCGEALRAKCCGCTEAFQASRAGSIPVARLVGPRGVAQSGSAPGWGPGGRRFKSCLPDRRKALLRRGFLIHWADRRDGAVYRLYLLCCSRAGVVHPVFGAVRNGISGEVKSIDAGLGQATLGLSDGHKGPFDKPLLLDAAQTASPTSPIRSRRRARRPTRPT